MVVHLILFIKLNFEKQINEKKLDRRLIFEIYNCILAYF